MNLFKTSILSGIATIVKVLSGLVINKILAVTVGPSGIALIGQFQNVFSMITTIGSGATATGVTKYVAENKDDVFKQNQYIIAALRLAILFSIIIGLFLIIFNNYLSNQILYNSRFKNLFILAGVTVIFNSLNLLLLAILNGLKQIKLFILSNVLGSLFSLLLAVLLTSTFNIYGALCSIILSQALLFFVTLYFLNKKYKIKNILTLDSTPQKVYKDLFRYSLMAIISIVTVPTVQILIRNKISNQISLEAAGIWQGVLKISDIYLLVITMAFATYYLPRLSEIRENKELKREIITSYKLIIPTTLLGAVIIYLMKDIIIQVLFSSDFIKMRELFSLQLLGDVFKMASWILGYLLIAKAMTKIYIITEIIFSIMLYMLSIILINIYGVQGATLAYCVNYFIYLLFLMYLFRKLLFAKS